MASVQEGDDDFGAVAWPGFVDILSSVIMMFIFFVLITSVIMFVMTMEFKKNLKKESEEQIEKKVSTEMAQILEMIENQKMTPEDIKKKLQQRLDTDKILRENEKLEHTVVELTTEINQIRSSYSGVTEQDTVDARDGLVIMYSKNDIALSEQTMEAIKVYIEQSIKSKGKKNLKISLIACDNPNAPTISVSRELSLARTLNIRNIILSSKLKPEQVNVQYIKADPIKGSYNWVKVIAE